LTDEDAFPDARGLHLGPPGLDKRIQKSSVLTFYGNEATSAIVEVDIWEIVTPNIYDLNTVNTLKELLLGKPYQFLKP